MTTELPYTLIAELTHRCRLSCAYCSNPVQAAPPAELGAAEWIGVLEQARDLGVVQVHFTGGEPLLYPALVPLVSRAAAIGLVSQVVTSSVGLGQKRLAELCRAGLSSIQISLHQVSDGDWPPSHALRAARWARELKLPVTLNLVLHRENLDTVAAAITLAEELGAARLELANVQYLGYAYDNRGALLPSSENIDRARDIARAARERLRGKLDLVFVLPDYHAGRPRSCMQGWGRRFIVVAPDGTALPCHAARVLGLAFDNVTRRSLEQIWFSSPAFNAYRGTDWMQEPCRSCEHRHLDFAGCRCQALLLTGDAGATDPACELSPLHDRVRRARSQPGPLVPLRARRFTAAELKP